MIQVLVFLAFDHMVQILDLFRLKIFADDTSSVVQMMWSVKVKNKFLVPSTSSFAT